MNNPSQVSGDGKNFWDELPESLKKLEGKKLSFKKGPVSGDISVTRDTNDIAIITLSSISTINGDIEEYKYTLQKDRAAELKKNNEWGLQNTTSDPKETDKFLEAIQAALLSVTDKSKTIDVDSISQYIVRNRPPRMH